MNKLHFTALQNNKSEYNQTPEKLESQLQTAAQTHSLKHYESGYNQPNYTRPTFTNKTSKQCRKNFPFTNQTALQNLLPKSYNRHKKFFTKDSIL
jgi:hypothetical protein